MEVTAMEITGKNMIGSKLASAGDKIAKAYDAATGEALQGEFVGATEAEVNETMELSYKAFQSYKNVPAEKRADFLDKIAEEIMNLGDSLVERATAESGLPAGRIQGERGRTCGQLQMFARLIREGSYVEAKIDTADPNRQPVPKPDTRLMLMPIGPIVVFAASNFPLAFSTAGGDTASALASGCPVVVKAHAGHPGTSELVASAIIKAAEATGMPDGVFSMLHGGGSTVGQGLVKHPRTKAVGFTGSTYAGRLLFDIANARPEPIPVFAEMGSINPVLLLPAALKANGEQIGKMYAGSVTLGVGQFCTSPGLLIGMKSPELDSFASALSEEIKSIAPGVMLNAKVQSGYVESKKEITGQNGVEVIAESNEEANQHQGRPTVAKVSGADFIANPALTEEVFGPFTMMVECDSKEQMEQVTEKLAGQLTATIMAEESEMGEFATAIENLQDRTGRILFNGVPTGVEVNQSMQHGGPYPAATDSRFTSVGAGAIRRFIRPVCFQNWPDAQLPAELQNANPRNVLRIQNNEYTRNGLS